MKTKKLAFVEQMLKDQWDYAFSNYVKRRDWWSFHCGHVAAGLQELGYEVKGFLKEELHSLPITKDTIVRGSIRTTRTALAIVGAKQPVNVDIPNCLREFAYRDVWETTLTQIRRSGKKVHIKPLEIQKGFGGHVYHRGESETKGLPGNMKILASERVWFGAEFRAYVLRGKVIFSEAETKEERDFVKKLIKHYRNAPVAYAIDCGWMVTEEVYNYHNDFRTNGKLAIVEINEGFSAGLADSSMPAIDYAKLTEARWKEIVVS